MSTLQKSVTGRSLESAPFKEMQNALNSSLVVSNQEIFTLYLFEHCKLCLTLAIISEMR